MTGITFNLFFSCVVDAFLRVLVSFDFFGFWVVPVFVGECVLLVMGASCRLFFSLISSGGCFFFFSLIYIWLRSGALKI